MNLSLASGPATAQPAAAGESASGPGLEQIVVTARKREESLQDTPVAVSAFGAEELELRTINTVAEVGRFAPNMQFDGDASESGGGGSNQIAIRGVGQTDYVITVEPGVGMYLDGVYIGKSVGSLIDNVDLERVEVLRGPQGTLFGKNTIGGAVVVTSKRPSDEFEFSAEIGGGRYDRLDFKTVLSGPLSDRLRVRATAASQNRDGYVDRIVTGETEGSKEALFGRVVAELDVAENFLATASFDVTRTNEEQSGRVLLRADENGFFAFLHNTFDFPACDPVVADPARFTNPSCYNSQWVTDLDDLENTSRGPNKSDTAVFGGSLTLAWDLGPISLKSITAYRSADVEIAQDLAPNPIVYFDWVGQDIEVESISQEVQLGGTAFNDRLTYLLGFFWLNEEGNQGFPVRFDPFSLYSGGSIDNTSIAGFAQGTYDITDRLSLTFGGRFTHEEIRFRPEQFINEIRNPVITAIIPTVVPGTPILPRVWVESTDNDFSPAATLSYRFTDDLLGYFTYSQGFKAGGFTMRAFPPVIPGVTTPITDPEEIIPAFGPEEVEQFEIGAKSEWLDRRMRLNVAGFVTNYDALQLLALTGIGGLVPVIFNAGDARIWGIEAEAELIATDWLRLNGSLGWMDHEYLEVDPNTAGVTEDNDLVNAPEWTASLGATADLMNNELGQVYLRADWSYKGSQFKDPSNEPIIHQDDYSLVSASLNWQSADEKWLATVGVTNLTDEIYIVSGIDNDGTGISAANPSRPREWFVRLKYSF
jgi:iron complex outermembrane receptor protein